MKLCLVLNGIIGLSKRKLKELKTICRDAKKMKMTTNEEESVSVND